MRVLATPWVGRHGKHIIYFNLAKSESVVTGHRSAWVMIIAIEVAAVAQLFNFRFDAKYLHDAQYPEPTVEWMNTTTTSVSPAIWVTIFLIAVGLVNVCPVRLYGWIGYVFGVCKMFLIVGLVLFNVVINARNTVVSTNPSRFRFWQSPYSAQSTNFTLHGNDPEHTRTIIGGAAHLASMWTAMTIATFSMIGFDTVAITAAETRDMRGGETTKLATRKISLRIVLLYSLAVFTVGLNVPYTDPNLRDNAINSLRSGQHSPFIIAAVLARIKGAPYILNGLFLFSATSAGISALYNSSRILHTLSDIPNVWPDNHIVMSLRRRLSRTYNGIPLAAVFVSWLFGLLAYLAVKPYPEEVELLCRAPLQRPKVLISM